MASFLCMPQSIKQVSEWALLRIVTWRCRVHPAWERENTEAFVGGLGAMPAHHFSHLPLSRIGPTSSCYSLAMCLESKEVGFGEQVTFGFTTGSFGSKQLKLSLAGFSARKNLLNKHWRMLQNRGQIEVSSGHSPSSQRQSLALSG